MGRCIEIIIFVLIAAMMVLACKDDAPVPYPSSPAARIIVNPETGERISEPAEVQLEEIPQLTADDLPDDGDVRIEVRDGLWRFTQDVIDKGKATSEDEVRVLMSLPLQRSGDLQDWLELVYTPELPEYLQFFSASGFTAMHAPDPKKIAELIAYLDRNGLKLDQLATNRLLLLVKGTIADVERAFDTEVHRIVRVERKDFAVEKPFTVPSWLEGSIDAVLAIRDQPELIDPIDDTTEPIDEPFPELGITPEQIGNVYDMDTLYEGNFTGRGQQICVIGGWEARRADVTSYWRLMGTERSGETEYIYTDVPPRRFSNETTVDVQMVGITAPDSDILVYLANDNTDFSLTWAINEAIGRGRCNIISYSFSHQEVITAWELQQFQNTEGRIAAAQGITFLAASGDSTNVDNPANAPWVTAVGASLLQLDEQGGRKAELDPLFGGRGRSALFAKPYWQFAVDPESDRRAIPDLALHCTPTLESTSIFVVHQEEWFPTGGTSLAAPMLAGWVGCLNQARSEKGQLGWLNRALYENEALQATFFDITETIIPGFAGETTPGWDFACGWGVPVFSEWMDLIP